LGSLLIDAIASPSFRLSGSKLQPQILAQFVGRPHPAASPVHDPAQYGLVDPGCLADFVSALAALPYRLSYAFHDHIDKPTGHLQKCQVQFCSFPHFFSVALLIQSRKSSGL
jgi:hypothetical protein